MFFRDSENGSGCFPGFGSRGSRGFELVELIGGGFDGDVTVGAEGLAPFGGGEGPFAGAEENPADVVGVEEGGGVG